MTGLVLMLMLILMMLLLIQMLLERLTLLVLMLTIIPDVLMLMTTNASIDCTDSSDKANTDCANAQIFVKGIYVNMRCHHNKATMYSAPHVIQSELILEMVCSQYMNSYRCKQAAMDSIKHDGSVQKGESTGGRM